MRIPIRPPASVILSWSALLLALAFSVCCIALSISVSAITTERDDNFTVVLGLVETRNTLAQIDEMADPSEALETRELVADRLEALARTDNILPSLGDGLTAAARIIRRPETTLEEAREAFLAGGLPLRDRQQVIYDALSTRWRLLTILAIASLALVAVMAMLVMISRRAGFEREKASRVEREHDEAIKAMRDSEALFHSLVDHVPLNIYRKDSRGRFTFANQRFCEELGEPMEKIVGGSDFEFFPKDLAEKYRTDDERVMQTGEVMHVIEEHTDPQGIQSFVEVIKSPVHDHRGRVIGTQGMYWDVTKRKLAEQSLKDMNETLEKRVRERTVELREANIQLERQKRELGEYASITAHDLKRPVVALHGLLSMIDEESADSLAGDGRENLTLAIAECRRMQQLVGDLSAVSRAERPPPRPQRVQLAEVVDACARHLEVAIESHQARLEIDCADDIHLITSRWHLQEALTNIMENALIHGCPDPGMKVSVAAKTHPDQVSIRVQDEGPGIPPEHHEDIFELFQRVGSPEAETGSGVGLCSVRRMIGSMGGAVFVESLPPHGATFTIRLPRGNGSSSGTV